MPRRLSDLSPVRRFIRFVVLESNGCMTWSGARAKGYGQFTDRGMHGAHRWAYEHWVGPIPEGLTIDHLCKNRACVNVRHLEPCTRGENVRRALHTGWCKSGRHPLTGSNLVTRRGGRLECRACCNERRRSRSKETVT